MARAGSRDPVHAQSGPGEQVDKLNSAEKHGVRPHPKDENRGKTRKFTKESIMATGIKANEAETTEVEAVEHTPSYDQETGAFH